MNNDIIANYVLRHENVLHELIRTANIPAIRIKQAMEYSLFPGGKRLRPLLVYLCGELIDIELCNLDMIAAAIELMHCYSLIHDDLPAMDNDDLRRGKPSCHRAFDEATAILVGDGMQALAVDILLSNLPQSIPLSHVIKITQELVKACGVSGMVSGQSLDLSELANPLISEHQLREIHILKTGMLIMACINMVIFAGNPCESSAIALRQFGEHLGLVFQMQDDYLDTYGPSDALGKGRASDMANEKITYASLYNKETLFSLISNHFEHAIGALNSFGKRADTLLLLVENVRHRIDV